jgi:hypothetical protein
MHFSPNYLSEAESNFPVDRVFGREHDTAAIGVS